MLTTSLSWHDPLRRPGARTVPAFLLLLAGWACAAPALSAVRINEVLADPASDWNQDGTIDYKNDEWIEVVNLGPDPEDLTGYWLRDAATAEPRLNLFGVIDPLQTAVFYGSDAVAWQMESGVTTAGFSLNNDGDAVTLLRTVPGSEGPVLEPVDTAVYKDHEADDDRSSGWDELGEQWILYDGLFPYTGTLDPPGTGCRPTPGEPNFCRTLVPAAPTSFGSLKATYL